MRFESISVGCGGFSVVAENSEERAMLNLAVAALEMVFPNTKDLSRPTPALLLLEALRIHANRMELSKNAVS